MALREFETGGRIAVVCTRRASGRREGAGICDACGAPALFLCDYAMEPGKVGGVTCDRALCVHCRRMQAKRTHARCSVDYCPEHDAIARARAAQEGDTNEAWGFTPDAEATPVPRR